MHNTAQALYGITQKAGIARLAKRAQDPTKMTDTTDGQDHHLSLPRPLFCSRFLEHKNVSVMSLWLPKSFIQLAAPAMKHDGESLSLRTAEHILHPKYKHPPSHTQFLADLLMGNILPNLYHKLHILQTLQRTGAAFKRPEILHRCGLYELQQMKYARVPAL